MVRFSDLLGGNGDPEGVRPAAVSTPLVAEPEARDEPEPDPELDAPPASAVESPKDVLDRLTQYATSARAGDQVSDPSVATPAAPDEPDPPSPPAQALTPDETADAFKPVGDDLLPRSGVARKSGRGRKRRP
jgi:hypothetical protein